MASLVLYWHLHQPFYGYPGERTVPTSIVLFRTLLNYHAMALFVRRAPGMKITFNLTPSLLKQIRDTADGSARDIFFDSLAAGGAPRETLELFVREFPDAVARRYPTLGILKEKLRDNTLTEQDAADLLVWLHLASFNPVLQDETVTALMRKNRGFSDGERTALAGRERDLLAQTLPLYQSLQNDGTAEISTTPFYHPILPLVCNSDTARRTKSSLSFPPDVFARPEDAREQVRRGLDYSEETFGKRPAGIWPSEGGLSEEALELLAGEGVRWTATDENLLTDTIRDGSRDRVHKLWRFRDKINIFFRDHQLSDLIGFAYHAWNERDAAADFAARLEQAAANRPGSVISVILDGENPWDWYPDLGTVFLPQLYARIITSKTLTPLTAGEALASGAEQERLDTLSPGGWMGLNYDNWIGRQPANKAWMVLKEARDTFERDKTSLPPETAALAREHLFVAEGSDWFWWYSLPAARDVKMRFDYLFRHNLRAVYQLLGRPAPAVLNDPIEKLAAAEEPDPVIQPIIDGRVTNYFEWRDAIQVDPLDLWLTLKPVELPVKRIFFGHDDRNLYCRLDFIIPFSGTLRFDFPETAVVIATSRSPGDGVQWAVDDIMEISIPLEKTGPDKKSGISFILRLIFPDGRELLFPPLDRFKIPIKEEEEWPI